MDRESFGRLLAPAAPRHRALEQLRVLFASLDREASLELRADALVELARWTRQRRAVPRAADSPPDELPEVSRFCLLVRAVEELPACREALAGVVASVLRDGSALNLFAQLGLPADRGLLGETLDRLSRRFLPEPMDPKSIAELLARLLPSPRDSEWLGALPADLVLRFARGLRLAACGSDELWRPLELCALDALRLVATRVSAAGLNDALRARSPDVPLDASPFFALPRATDAYVGSVRAGAASELAVGRERWTSRSRADERCKGSWTASRAPA